MPRQAGPDRVLGPYPHRDGFRIIGIEAGRRIPSKVFPTKKEAQEFKREYEQTLAAVPLTYGDMMEQFAEYKRAKGNRPRSVDTDMHRVRRFFADWEDRPCREPTENEAQRLYEALRETPTKYGKPPSAAEHQNGLKAARRFGNWMVRAKKWRSNPLAHVEMMGRANRGKLQLSRDQGRMWLAGALAAHDMGDATALAAAVCLMLGCRAGEIASRRVSHLDDGGTYLRITESKSDNGIRGLPILDADLQAALVEQARRAREWARGQDPQPIDPPLFPPVACHTTRHATRDDHISVWSVRRAVHRVCRAVGIPTVTTHALRGTFSSRAAARGVAIAAVAADLGNRPAIAARHYATQESQMAGQAESFHNRYTGVADTDSLPLLRPSSPTGTKGKW